MTHRFCSSDELHMLRLDAKDGYVVRVERPGRPHEPEPYGLVVDIPAELVGVLHDTEREGEAVARRCTIMALKWWLEELEVRS